MFDYTALKRLDAIMLWEVDNYNGISCFFAYAMHIMKLFIYDVRIHNYILHDLSSD